MLAGKFNQLHVSSISAPRQFALGSFEISLALSDVFSVLVVIISFLLVFNITLINLKAQSLSFTILRINCSLQELNN